MHKCQPSTPTGPSYFALSSSSSHLRIGSAFKKTRRKKPAQKKPPKKFPQKSVKKTHLYAVLSKAFLMVTLICQET
jgi:hypothetical protein